MKIAAVGDVHFAEGARGTLRPHLEDLHERADVLLIAGDLTRIGLAEEAEVLADELAGLDIPIVAILGNHDYHSGEEKDIIDVMEGAGVEMLDAENHVIPTAQGMLGITGVKGFGGGFAGANGTEFGEPEMKAFVRHTRDAADRLADLLERLDADHKVALLHYSPIEETLKGERLEIFPFLGSCLLAEAIDRAKPDLAIHGHAHAGIEEGATPAGVPVRNVAMTVIDAPYALYELNGNR
jgi:Icc-related predicted phosphoesterase